MITIHLTPKEADVVRHRLEVPDAIAEVFGPDNDNVWPHLTSTSDVLDHVAEIMARTFKDGPRGSMAIELEEGDQDQLTVLGDVLDGNTMPSIALDMMEYETSDPDYRRGYAWVQAMRSINGKMEAAGLSCALNI